MRVRKTFIAKCILAVVSLIFIALLLKSDDAVEIPGASLAKLSLDRKTFGDGNKIDRTFLKDTWKFIFEAGQCISSLKDWVVTANFTMNNVLDKLKVQLGPATYGVRNAKPIFISPNFAISGNFLHERRFSSKPGSK